jgi:ferredoxin
MKIAVDPDRCVASGQCVMLAPELFDQDDDGIVILIDDVVADDRRDSAQQAIRVCPSAAITQVG